MSVLLIVAAIALAVAGIEVRIVRTVYEFAHHTSRFQAKQVALGHLAERLQVEHDAPASVRALW